MKDLDRVVGMDHTEHLPRCVTTLNDNRSTVAPLHCPTVIPAPPGTLRGTKYHAVLSKLLGSVGTLRYSGCYIYLVHRMETFVDSF